MNIRFPIFAIFLVSLSAFALTDDAYNTTLSDIVWKRSPGRGIGVVNADVVAPIVEAWATTNAPANPAQTRILNRWRIILGGMNADDKVFDAAYAALRAETNTVARVAEYEQVIRFLGRLHANTPAPVRINARAAIEKILVGSTADFSEARQMDIHALIAVKGVEVFRDRAKAEWDRHFEAVKAMPDLKPFRPRALGQMITGLFPLGREEARAAYEQNQAFIGESEEAEYLLAYAAACRTANDRPNFDRTVETIAAFKPERRARPYADILKQMNGFDEKTSRELLEAELARPGLTPGDRAVYLDAKIVFYSPSVFNYGYNEPGRYETWKAALKERMVLPGFNAAYCNGYVGIAIGFDDLKFAEELIAVGLAKIPDSASLLAKRAQVKVIRGDTAGAVADLEAAAQGKGFGRDESAALFRRVAAWLAGKGEKGIDAVDAEKALDPAARLKAFREVGRWLYNVRLYEECRAIQRLTSETMLRAREVKTFAAVYDADAPRTAEGFVRSKYYDDWAAMETRFEAYGADYHMRASLDADHLLKGMPPKPAHPDYPTGVKIIADNDGVHFFIRCDDPAIDEVKTGKRADAGSLEIFFEPGDHEVPYHSVFFEKLPGVKDSTETTWAMPGRHFRRTEDIVAKDAVITDKGVVAHMYVPWIGCYDTLPFGGRHWLFGVYRWHPKGGSTLGGMVHALARGLRVEFPFTPDQIAALQRRIAETAFNRYTKLRDGKGDYIQRWNDDELGDPEFFAQEIGPLLKTLDEKGKNPRIEDAADWAEIDAEIAERRTRYLKRKLLEE